MMMLSSPYRFLLWLALVTSILSQLGCEAYLSSQSSSSPCWSSTSTSTRSHSSGVKRIHGCVIGTRTRQFIITGLNMAKQDDMNINDNNNDDDDDDNSQHDTSIPQEEDKHEEKDEPISLAELAQLEERASRRIQQRLLLPTRIGEAITFGVQLFVVFGLFLNMNGYGYVMRNDGSHWIGIDTLENRQFQMELRKKN